MLKKLLALTLAALFSLSAIADEASIKKALETKLGGKISSVTKTPYLDLYEVYAEGQIFYTDEKMSAILAGPLFDGKTMKNVTSERLQKLNTIDFSGLPLDLAIKLVRGNGKRVLATFEDPNCGYCKKLAQELAELNDITVYTFLMPILSPDSLEKAQKIWCSTDRGRAWREWMINGKAPQGKGDCDTTAIEKTVELGHKLSITGTPTLFFTDGSRIPGAAPMPQIEKRLEQTMQASSGK